MDKIGIIVGRMGNPAFLEQCIESVVRQSSDMWELYIPEIEEDAEFKNIVSKYENDTRIKLIKDTSELSYAELLNKIIEDSDCEIIGLLDGNDSLSELCVEKVLHFYEAFCSTGLIYTNYVKFNEADQSKTLGDCLPVMPWQSLLDHSVLGPFLTFRKESFNKTSKFEDGLTNAEEIDIAYKIDEVARTYFINEPLYSKRESNSSDASPKIEYVKIARYNALKRRGLPNTNNALIRFLNMDYYSAKKLGYKKNRKRKKEIDPEIGIENLVSAKNILDRLNMRNWLTDGTLLGCYRDNMFIKHDDDLDLGAYISEYKDDLIMEFIKDGWLVDRIFGRYETGLEISFMRNNLKLDIFFFYEEDDILWHACWVKTRRGLNLVKYIFEKFDLKEIEFYGHLFKIPKDTLKYVTAKYGESWNTPVKVWDYINSPPNSRKTNFYL